jgi:hypothetical protein
MSDFDEMYDGQIPYKNSNDIYDLLEEIKDAQKSISDNLDAS